MSFEMAGSSQHKQLWAHYHAAHARIVVRDVIWTNMPPFCRGIYGQYDDHDVKIGLLVELTDELYKNEFKIKLQCIGITRITCS